MNARARSKGRGRTRELALAFLVAILSLSLYSYALLAAESAARAQAHAQYVIPPNLTSIIFVPHGVWVKNISVTTLSALFCYIKANASTLQIQVTQQGPLSAYEAGKLRVLAATPVTDYVQLPGTLHFEPGSYTILILNTGNQTIKVTVVGYCEVRPIG